MKFNINNYVKVKLTQVGIDELKRQHEEQKIAHERLRSQGIDDFVLPKVDADGYSEFQLFNLMAIFGDLMWEGLASPFEIEIIIDEPKGG